MLFRADAVQSACRGGQVPAAAAEDDDSDED